MKICPFSKQQK